MRRTPRTLDDTSTSCHILAFFACKCILMHVLDLGIISVGIACGNIGSPF